MAPPCDFNQSKISLAYCDFFLPIWKSYLRLQYPIFNIVWYDLENQYTKSYSEFGTTLKSNDFYRNLIVSNRCSNQMPSFKQVIL